MNKTAMDENKSKKFSFNMNSMDILRFSISVALFNIKSMEILRFSLSVELFTMKSI